jgi:hypothetical protein
MNVQRALSSRLSNARTSTTARVAEGRATEPKGLAASVRCRFRSVRRACVGQRRETTSTRVQLGNSGEESNIRQGSGRALWSHSVFGANTGSAHERGGQMQRVVRCKQRCLTLPSRGTSKG